MESPLEQRLKTLLEGAGVIGWTAQHEIGGRRVDVAFVAERLAVQVDSYLHHSSRTDWAKDHARNRDLVEAGFRVLPVTKEDLDDGQTFLARLAAARAAGVPK
jgi:very-short-patch-repair endonuclease